MNEEETPTILRVLPNDVLVVYSPHVLGPKRAEEIMGPLKQALPEGARILVLGEGLKLGILRGLKPDTPQP